MYVKWEKTLQNWRTEFFLNKTVTTRLLLKLHKRSFNKWHKFQELWAVTRWNEKNDGKQVCGWRRNDRKTTKLIKASSKYIYIYWLSLTAYVVVVHCRACLSLCYIVFWMDKKNTKKNFIILNFMLDLLLRHNNAYCSVGFFCFVNVRTDA